MNILWITNLPLPEAQEHLFNQKQVKEGWLVQLSHQLSTFPDIQLCVASRTLGLAKETDFVTGNIHHYCFPSSYADNEGQMSRYWLRTFSAISPDVVHIQGTECTHSATFVKCCPYAKTVVSIQGMASVISRFFYGGIPERDLTCLSTWFNKCRGNTIRKNYKRMIRMGEREKYILGQVKYAIGRTDWDKVHVTAINPSIRYFVGNETMRPLFYENRWTLDQCTPHSIFVTQCMAPYKGGHQMLLALSIIKEYYPDVKLRFALAPNLFKTMSWKAKMLANEYATYLRKLTLEKRLEKNIDILGPLDEKEMVKAMLSSHVFVSPSAIENSPNSLCEAQLLGIPAVASYVGGTPTIADHGRATELYRYEEVEMLAAKIMRIFNEGPDKQMLENARMLAHNRHDVSINVNHLLDIYHTISA